MMFFILLFLSGCQRPICYLFRFVRTSFGALALQVPKSATPCLQLFVCLVLFTRPRGYSINEPRFSFTVKPVSDLLGKSNGLDQRARFIVTFSQGKGESSRFHRL